MISEGADINRGAIMAKRKKRSKVQTGAKRRKGYSAKRSRARKPSKSATKKATKRPIAGAKRAAVKRPAQKQVPPSAIVVETIVVEEATPDTIIVAEGLDPAA